MSNRSQTASGKAFEYYLAGHDNDFSDGASVCLQPDTQGIGRDVRDNIVGGLRYNDRKQVFFEEGGW